MEIIIALAVVVGFVAWYYNRKPAVKTAEVTLEETPVVVEQAPFPMAKETTPAEPVEVKVEEVTKPRVQKTTTKPAVKKPTVKKAPAKNVTAKRAATKAKKTTAK